MVSRPSGNGKKASEAATVPLSGRMAFIAPNRAASTRLISPAHSSSLPPPRPAHPALTESARRPSTRALAPPPAAAAPPASVMPPPPPAAEPAPHSGGARETTTAVAPVPPQQPTGHDRRRV